MKRFFGAALSVAVLASAFPALGAVEQTGDETVTISASTGVANAKVGVQIFTEGKTAEELAGVKESDGNFMDILVFHDQCMTDENGDFSIDADLYCESGKYDVYVGLSDGTELLSETIVFVNNEDYKKTAKSLNEQTTASGVKAIISANPYVVGLSPEELEDINLSDFSEVLLNTLDETPMNEENRGEAWEIAKKALFVQELNEGKVLNVINEDADVTELFESEIKSWVEADFVTDNLLENFTARLKDAKSSSYGEYKDSLIECFVLATVLYPNGSGNIKDIVTEFEDELGVDVDSDTAESTWSKLAGKDYDLADFQEDFEKFAEGGSSNGGGSSSGGSGSGSSSTKKPAGIGALVTSPVTDNKTAENQMNPVIFDDIDNVEWAKNAIVYLAERQIIDGVGNYKFNPNGNVTREQFAKIVVNAFTPDAEGGENAFVDVVADSWYAPFVSKAYAKGIVSGMGDGSFGVGLPITRQDMCVMIYNAATAAGLKLPENSNPHRFEDDEAIADYAKTAVYSLKEIGAINGVDTENFAPRANASRAQAAKIIYYLVTEM